MLIAGEPPPITAEQIQTAIDRGIQYLCGLQEADGSIGDDRVVKDVTGSTALAALAMLAAGKHPDHFEPLRKALDFVMANSELDDTYARAVRVNTWEYALRKLPHDEKITAALGKDYAWLLKALGDKEGWRYTLAATGWDNSVTQYGVLGVWAAQRAGHQPPKWFWPRMAKHFLSCQNPDGGWGYQTGGSTANMVTAGLATMFLVFDSYYGRTSYTRENPRVFVDGEAAACLASLEKGMNYIGEKGGNVEDNYYLYGIERAGVASGRKYFGGRDWFLEGAVHALKTQRADGYFPSTDRSDSSLTMLFLVYGGAPVAFNKLEYGLAGSPGAERQDWNLNPRDVANLTKQMWYAYERPLNWHSVNLNAPASEFEAPILVITGSKSATFNDTHVARLREYIDRGGMILAEASDRSEAFALSMEKLAAQLYPPESYPQAALTELTATHPIFNVINGTWQKRPQLRAVSDGSRIVFVLSDDYMSADWQENNTKADGFNLAVNLLFYANDNGTLAGKYASYLPKTPPAAAQESRFTVARVRFTSAESKPYDWDAGKYAWQRFSPYLAHTTGHTVLEHQPAKLSSDEIPNAHLLHITGRGAFELTEDERKALKKYVEAGGTILIDAYGGAPRFAESAKREMSEIFGALKPLPNHHALIAGAFPGGTDLSKNIRYKNAARSVLRAAELSTREHALKVAYHSERPAVIYSHLDLTSAVAGVRAFECVGYDAKSAMQLLTNVCGYVMLR